jgi:hypothetical protein
MIKIKALEGRCSNTSGLLFRCLWLGKSYLQLNNVEPKPIQANSYALTGDLLTYPVCAWIAAN